MHAQTDPAQPVPGPAEAAARNPEDTDPRAGIEQAVAALEDLDTLPLSEHVSRFEDVHTTLAAALSSIDKV